MLTNIDFSSYLTIMVIGCPYVKLLLDYQKKRLLIKLLTIDNLIMLWIIYAFHKKKSYKRGQIQKLKFKKSNIWQKTKKEDQYKKTKIKLNI